MEELGEERGKASPSPPTTLPSTTVSAKPVEVEVSKPPVKEASLSLAEGGIVRAPLPGVILSVKRRVGEEVRAGDTLLTLEAMKMENEIYAPTSGVIKKVAVLEKEKVGQGDLLVVIE